MNRQRKGNLNCCVKKCKNRLSNTTSEIKFYVFPTASYKVLQRERWIRWIQKINGTSDWQPTKNSRICCEHFIGNASSTSSLSPSYVPTIVLRNQDNSFAKESSSIQRFERSLKRRTHSVSMEPIIYVKGEPGNIDFPESKPILKVDREIQVCVFDKHYRNPFGDDSKVFFCHRYSSDNISHLQVQVYIPQCDKTPQVIRKLNKSDKLQGSSPLSMNETPSSDHLDVNYTNISFYGFSSITEDKEILDLCGVNSTTFDLLLRILMDVKGSKVQNKNHLMIFLMKLKTGLSFTSISLFFNIKKSTVSQIFFFVLKKLRIACDKYIPWPCGNDSVEETVRQSDSKISFKDCKAVIDFIEITIIDEQLNPKGIQVDMYSVYKRRFTTKFLIGCTLGGAISFISKCYSGRTSDYQITVTSGILKSLDPGYRVIANRDFPNVENIVEKNNEKEKIVMVMPSGNHNVDETITQIKFQIEKVIRKVKDYRILDKFSTLLLPYIDDILFVCGALVNLQSRVIKNEDIAHDLEPLNAKSEVTS